MGYYDVPADKLIAAVVAELKKSAPEVKPPSWAQFVKTGMSKERAPTQKDWWHIRAASMLRKIGMLGPIGTSKLAVQYGSRKNMGMAPERFRQGSTNIIRKILQQLEKAGLIKHGAKGVHKGRMITPKGHSLLDKSSDGIMKELKIVIPKTPPPPTAEELAAQREEKKKAVAAAKKPRKAAAPAQATPEVANPSKIEESQTKE